MEWNFTFFFFFFSAKKEDVQFIFGVTGLEKHTKQSKYFLRLLMYVLPFFFWVWEMVVQLIINLMLHYKL